MDLGFDDIENTIGYQPEMEEKCVQLSEQLDWGLGQLWHFDQLLVSTAHDAHFQWLHLPPKKLKILNPHLQTCHID